MEQCLCIAYLSSTAYKCVMYIYNITYLYVRVYVKHAACMYSAYICISIRSVGRDAQYLVSVGRSLFRASSAGCWEGRSLWCE